MENKITIKNILYGLFLITLVLLITSILSPVISNLIALLYTRKQYFNSLDLIVDFIHFFSFTILYIPGSLINLLIMIFSKKGKVFLPIIMSLMVFVTGDLLLLFTAMSVEWKNNPLNLMTETYFFLFFKYLTLYFGWSIVYKKYMKRIM